MSTQMRIAKKNSSLSSLRKTTQFYWGIENSKRQMKGKHGHVVISAVCRKRNSKSLYFCIMAVYWLLAYWVEA